MSNILNNLNLGELALELIRLDQLVSLGRADKIEDHNNKWRIQVSNIGLGDPTPYPILCFYQNDSNFYIAIPYSLVMKMEQLLFIDKTVYYENGAFRTPTYLEISDMRARIIYEIGKYHEKIEPIKDKDFTIYVDLSKTALTTDNVTSITSATNSFNSTISATFFDT